MQRREIVGAGRELIIKNTFETKAICQIPSEGIPAIKSRRDAAETTMTKPLTCPIMSVTASEGTTISARAGRIEIGGFR